ncbi:hypothetical protein ABTX77_26860 [Streptomyces sp. NPDC097704]|uniref:hypothetical protein n=1 Tax=Streptomyces sp. NPDC097704 TaxID=3157101 RepID=UPI003326A8F1
MKSYAVQVHHYGSVAVVTLCAWTDPADGPTCPEPLVQILSGIGAGVGSVVLDLDRAPYPAAADALATIGTWAGEREISVVALTPGDRGTETRRSGTPAVRAAPINLTRSHAPGPSDDEALVRRLQRALGVRALVHQAVGIRQARHRAHPCT